MKKLLPPLLSLIILHSLTAASPRLARPINVLEFGATGNGVTDDTVAIQNAINSITNSGGTLVFPEGTYPITNTITIPVNGITLKGESFKRPLLECRTGSNPAINIPTNPIPVWSGLIFTPCIQDIRLSGITNSLGVSASTGLKINKATEAVFDNVQIYGFDVGLHVVYTESTYFNQSLISYNKTNAIIEEANLIIFDKANFFGPLSNNIVLGSVYQMSINNSWLEMGPTYTGPIIDLDSTDRPVFVREFKIDGCTITSVASSSATSRLIRYKTGGTYQSTANVEVKNNYLYFPNASYLFERVSSPSFTGSDLCWIDFSHNWLEIGPVTAIANDAGSYAALSLNIKENRGVAVPFTAGVASVIGSDTSEQIGVASSTSVFGDHYYSGSLTVTNNLTLLGTLNTPTNLTLRALTLSDTNTLGASIVVNGDFASTTNGWWYDTATNTIVAGGVSGNCLSVAGNGVVIYGSAFQEVLTIPGQKYVFSFYCKKGTATYGQARLSTNRVNWLYSSPLFFSTSWTYDRTEFVAPSTSVFISLFTTPEDGKTILFDDVKIEPIRGGALNAFGNVLSGGSVTATNFTSSGEVVGNLFRQVAPKITTTNYTILGTNSWILANCATGAVTLTLPSASTSSGIRFMIKKIDSTTNVLYIAAPANHGVDGQAALTNAAPYMPSYQFISDGNTNWYAF